MHLSTFPSTFIFTPFSILVFFLFSFFSSPTLSSPLTLKPHSLEPPYPLHPRQSPPDPDSQAALDTHNSNRTALSLPPYTWDTTLASAAASYAQTIASTQSLTHSGVPDQGENLAVSGAGAWTLADATAFWLDEVNLYSGEVIPQGDFEAYGHYTQCVWNGTARVGMGSAFSEDGRMWIVGRYAPPGNVIGQKPF
ncbi:MAG: hypothetical protein Q9227_003442 [Pyrenula ochraceoflavens]